MHDSTYTIEEDSSERIKQWGNFHKQQLYASVFERKQSAFSLAIHHPAYKRDVTLDTTGKFVSVSEQWYGQDMRVPITMTLDDYIAERIAFEKRKMWEDSIYAYNFKNLMINPRGYTSKYNLQTS